MLLPSQAPVMTLRNVILFPQAMLPLYIFEDRYRRMLEDCLNTNRMFAVAMQRPGSQRETPVSVAGLGLIRAAIRNADGTFHLVLQGLARIELDRRVPRQPYRVHQVRPIRSSANPSVAVHALTARVLELVNQRLKLGLDSPFKLAPPSHPQPPTPSPPPETPVADTPSPATAFNEVLEHLSRQEDPEQLVDLVSATLLPQPFERQVILETPDLEERLRHLVRFLVNDLRRRQTT